MKGINKIFTCLAIVAIRGYKVVLSPVFRSFGGRCRFEPDCSTYGLQAVQRFGAFKGSWLTLKRIAKCGPFHPGGVDKVPEKCCDKEKD